MAPPYGEQVELLQHALYNRMGSCLCATGSHTHLHSRVANFVTLAETSDRSKIDRSSHQQKINRFWRDISCVCVRATSTRLKLKIEVT